MGTAVGKLIDQHRHMVRENESLAPFTWLQLGGPSAYLVEPADPTELVTAVRAFSEEKVPMRILGGGSNILVRESGFDGATLLLTAPAFSKIAQEGTTVTCGGGTKLSHLITHCVGAGLAGLEHLVGIPGTVGGALHGNAGTDDGDIGQVIRSATLLKADGSVVQYTADRLSFSHRVSSLDELIILDATFELEQRDVRGLTKREQTFWIVKRSKQPSFPTRAAIAFIDPDGYSAVELIQHAGMSGTIEGSVQLSTSFPNFVIASTGATSVQLLSLLERVRRVVQERSGVQLQLHLQIW